MKTVSSYKASPYRKELFQSNVISTPLNQKNNYSEYRTHPTNQTLTYQKNLTDSIERKIRESRKKEVITKLNELNSKLGGGQSKHSFFSNKPTKDNFCSNIKTPLTSSMFPSK